MNDFRRNLEKEGFRSDDVELTEMYVSLVFNLLESDPQYASALRKGISKLALKMNAIAPEIEEGKLAGGITPEDLAMEPIPSDAVMTFIEITGTIMLASQDGPMGSAVSLKKAVDEVADRIGAR